MPSVLPDHLEGPDGLVVRRWLPDDAPALGAAVAESIDHLRPWMAWVADEPLTLERRRAMLLGWEREWESGGDVGLGVFLDGRIAGGCACTIGSGPAASNSATGSTRGTCGAGWPRGRRSC